jgi:hypothetical protein
LKQQVYDRWQAGDPTYDVVRFDSTTNPVFPAAEFERARRELPKWKFDLFYREYHAGHRTIRQHAAELMRGEFVAPTCVGGSHSDDQWRNEFRLYGLKVQRPEVRDVEVGLDRVAALHASGKYLVFDDLKAYREEKTSYSREVDMEGNPTEKILDKSQFHLMDAERYVASHLERALRRLENPARYRGWRGKSGGWA